MNMGTEYNVKKLAVQIFLGAQTLLGTITLFLHLQML